MDTSELRNLVHEKVEGADHEALESALRVLENDENGWYSELPDEIKDSLRIAKEEVRSGKTISQEEMRQEVEAKYLKK